MIVLGIETSCDETALALIEAEDDSVRVLANITHSQAALHAKYGGVFPSLAKREHAKNLIPVLEIILRNSGFLKLKTGNEVHSATRNDAPDIYSQILENLRIDRKREPELWKAFDEFIPTIEKPPIDAIAVTYGPGLEPALWVGINFVRALSAVWNIPVIPTNHMEGHIVSALLRRNANSKSETLNSKQTPNFFEVQSSSATRYTLHVIRYPAIALLISGGHTELILVKKLGQYKIIGETKDDAVGEAFDKVARILGLPYPGGPEIYRLAERARSSRLRVEGSALPKSCRHFCRHPVSTGLWTPGVYKPLFSLPRPMLHSGDYHLSFSGLKTAVLYTVKKIPKLTAAIKQALAKEFEDSVTEVLISKTTKAIKEYEAKTLIIAGGVIANKHIRASFEELQQSAFPALALLIPEIPHSTDNALMIALAGYLNLKSGRKPQKADQIKIIAEGRARLA